MAKMHNMKKSPTARPTPNVIYPFSFHPSASPTVFNAGYDVAQYSYICMVANQSLCIGISPGPTDPVYNPNAIFPIQVKNRVRNELANLDYKKDRWDVSFTTKTIWLSRFQNLCMSQPFANRLADSLGLFPCSNLSMNGTKPNRGLWNLTFHDNVNKEGTLRLYNTNLCATVMLCELLPENYCNPDSNVIAKTGASDGGYVKSKPCWNAPGGDPSYKSAQMFTQKLDCAVGCPPYLQNNGVCDPPCDNYACNLDNGACISVAPTPPTPHPTTSPLPSPTQGPTTPEPTKFPTTIHPTPQPTSAWPTTKPSSKPTSFPSSSPSTAPSPRPSFRPTEQPVNQPSTDQPTSSPSVLVTLAAPILPPPPNNTGTIVAVAVPLLLLFFLCCLVALCVRQRRKRLANDPSNWKSPVNANRDAYLAWKNAKIPWWHRATCLLCYTRPAINVKGWAPEEDTANGSATASPTKKSKLTGV